MSWQYTSYVLPLLIAAAVSVALALYALRRRDVPGAVPFAVLMLGAAEWSLGYTVELGSASLSAKVFWSNVNFVGIVVIPMAWLVFALQYAGYEKWLTHRNLALLAIEPLVTLLLAWTNEAHGLLRSNVRLDTSGTVPMLAVTYGTGFWVYVAYSYLLIFFATLLLLRVFVRSPRLYRGQIAASLVSLLIPFVGNALHIYGWSPFPHLDLTPFSFTLSGLILAWGFFRFRLFDLVPVARDAVIEGMDDGVMVLDMQNRVVDINLPAARIIDRSVSEIIGQPGDQVLSAWPDLIEHCRDVAETHTEIALDVGERQRRYDLRISPLFDQRGHLVGRLLASRDITERKQAEEEIRQHIAQLETLRQVGLELTSQLDLDTLLRSIVSRAIELLGAIEGGLYLYRPDRDVLEWAMAIGPHTAPLGSILHRGEGLCGKVWDAGEPLAVDDYQHWEGRAAIYEGYSFAATVGVPVYWGEEFLGVLNVNSHAPRVFSPDNIELLSLFATHAAIAIRNARLYEEAQQRALEQGTLRGAVLALTTTLDRGEVIDRILAQLREVVPYDTASVQLLRESCLEIVGGRGFPNLEEMLGISFDPSRENNPNREVIRTRASFIVDDAPTVYEEFLRDPHAAAGVRSWLGVPMVVGEQLIGMIALDKSEPGFYTPEHARLAEAFAAQAAIAIENARLHQEVLDHAEQLEQRVRERTTEFQTQYAQLDAILNSTTDAIVVADAEGSIVQTNPVAQAWLTQTLSPEDSGRLRKAIQDVARRADETPELVLELTGLDLALSAAPVMEEGREESSAVVVDIHDVSHLKALERMRANLVANISHELRTPVTTIQSYAYLMQQTPPEDEKWEQYLNALVRETEQQVRLGEDILQISRIYTGRLRIESHPTSLNELVEAAITNHRALAQERELALEYRPLKPGLVVSVDPKQMTQVLNILMDDAIHYTPEGGQVMVSTGTEKAEGRVWATVTVSNSGEGIPTEDLPYIFERFFREEEPRSVRVSETGLRLMIVKGIVELHGGRVTVESEEGMGSTFTIWLLMAD